MCGLRSLTVFLITTVFLVVCTSGNSESNSDYEIKCQGKVMKINCLNKSYVIVITSVFYGRKRPGAQICRSPRGSYLSDEITCVESDVKESVKTICENQNSCNFTVEDETFDNNDCLSVYKYMIVKYTCVSIDKIKRDSGQLIERPVGTSSTVIRTSTITPSSTMMTSQVLSTVHPTSTIMVNVDKFTTISSKTRSSSPSSSPSSSRPHSVSVTTVSHTKRLPATSVAIESPSLKTTKPTSKTYANSATFAGQHGTMKLFRFILSFHIIREEKIHKHTASSVVWFMFGLLVGLFIMIAVLVYYRVKKARRERQDKPDKATYVKQRDCNDGSLEEKVILHPKELEALEMESQLGETV